MSFPLNVLVITTVLTLLAHTKKDWDERWGSITKVWEASVFIFFFVEDNGMGMQSRKKYTDFKIGVLCTWKIYTVFTAFYERVFVLL